MDDPAARCGKPRISKRARLRELESLFSPSLKLRKIYGKIFTAKFLFCLNSGIRILYLAKC